MCTDMIDVHNRLSAPLTKIEVLTRLRPVAESDREQVEVLTHLLEMVADYAHLLRQTLDDLARGGVRS